MVAVICCHSWTKGCWAIGCHLSGWYIAMSVYILTLSKFSVGCVCRSATERICRLQEALDERKQQFNNMATKYDVITECTFVWSLCAEGRAE